jgi:hypothetical protein
MSQQTICDGCGKPLTRKLGQYGERACIHGQRDNGLGGGLNLPDGEFDWCSDCATIGFTAVHDAKKLKVMPER